MNAAAWWLLAAFGVIAAADWVAVARRSKPLEYVCKPGCMVALIAAALVMDPSVGSARVALVVALVLSMLGDVFLMLPEDRWFVPGLGSFLLAHVAYVVAFVLEGLEPAGAVAGLVVAVAVVGTVGRRVVREAKASDEPELAAPVGAYVGVIATMVAAAVATTDPRAAVGAVTFATSDSLIAWRKFIRFEPWMPMAVIVTYHAAQALLLLSFS